MTAIHPGSFSIYFSALPFFPLSTSLSLPSFLDLYTDVLVYSSPGSYGKLRNKLKLLSPVWVISFFPFFFF